METGRSGHVVPTQQAQDEAAEHLPNPRQIEAFSNAEFAKHLWENSRCVMVQDPENISESFLEKLKEMVRSHNMPHSAVVDLDGVNAKLLATEHKKRPREAFPASLDRVTEILDDMENGEVSNHRDLAAVKLIQNIRAGDRGLASYVESVRTNALVPFNLQTNFITKFHPTQDPIMQNALTTWLEYVAYGHV
ncbi:hypothetical protein MCOR27_009586 [Pyricularia oryzae]|nr:hypothetical protein MCOR27_009586 [Pyricularia oryzae]KAI6451821.1 hypothetical protein MCOR15_009150 [Pyricularia oryzae]KAI6484079.1 hypothetical protein MCOR11_010262 [Pyricularia oryzae]KAI6517066.1 hypothetical protein MCOR10_007464 [Pyricularia oryzae]KAI6520860.1 hypothetical protein MCOR16_008102 [Pyricularia oryzae]